jgi:hypothetical protein
MTVGAVISSPSPTRMSTSVMRMRTLSGAARSEPEYAETGNRAVAGPKGAVCRCVRVGLSCGGPVRHEAPTDRHVVGRISEYRATNRVEDDVERRTGRRGGIREERVVT